VTGPVAILLMLGAVYALALRGRSHRWNPRLGNMRVRTASGPNFATLLGAVGVATLLLNAAKIPALQRHPGYAPILVGVAVALLFGYLIVQDFTKLVVGGIGVVLLIATEGVGNAVSLAILAALLVWLLGAFRGWIG
jgi:hypothetical protein